MKISFEQLEEIVVVPSGDFSSGFYAPFYSSPLFEEIQGYMPQNGEVLRCISGVHSAIVFSEGDEGQERRLAEPGDS